MKRQSFSFLQFFRNLASLLTSDFVTRVDVNPQAGTQTRLKAATDVSCNEPRQREFDIGYSSP
jgi:hypothetical protein